MKKAQISPMVKEEKQKPTYWADYVTRFIRFVAVFLKVVVMIFFIAGAGVYLIKNSVFLSNFFGPLFTSQLNWVFPLCVKGFFLTGGVLFGGALLLTIVVAVLKKVCPGLTAKSRFLSWLILDYEGQSASADVNVIDILIKGEHYDFLERMHVTKKDQELCDKFVDNAELLKQFRAKLPKKAQSNICGDERASSNEVMSINFDDLMKCPTLIIDALMSKEEFRLLNKIFTDVGVFKNENFNEFMKRTDIKDIKMLNALWDCPVLAGVVINNNIDYSSEPDVVLKYYLRSTVSQTGKWTVNSSGKNLLTEIDWNKQNNFIEKLIKRFNGAPHKKTAGKMLNYALQKWADETPSDLFLKDNKEAIQNMMSGSEEHLDSMTKEKLTRFSGEYLERASQKEQKVKQKTSAAAANPMELVAAVQQSTSKPPDLWKKVKAFAKKLGNGKSSEKTKNKSLRSEKIMTIDSKKTGLCRQPLSKEESHSPNNEGERHDSMNHSSNDGSTLLPLLKGGEEPEVRPNDRDRERASKLYAKDVKKVLQPSQ